MKVKLIILFILFSGLPSLAQMRIVCIGNSITQGKNMVHKDSTYEYSYRPWLWEKLVQQGFNVDMVGYHPYFFDEKPGKLVLEFKSKTGKKFDRDNEAYYGITSSGFLNGTKSSGWTGQPLPKFADRINDPEKGYTPDFALIHIGTNDADSSKALVNKTKENIKGIVQVLRAKNPQVVILLAKLITGWKKINPEIDGLCAELTTTQSPVIAVDLTTGFINDPKLPGTMTYDHVHPNSGGQKFMMERWHKALLANLNDKVKPQLKGSLAVSKKSKSAATLSWPSGSDNYGLKQYDIYGNGKQIGSVPATQKEIFTASNLKPGTKYTFKVVAKDYNGNYSAPILVTLKSAK